MFNARSTRRPPLARRASKKKNVVEFERRKGKNLIWEKTGSFTFPGEENEEDVPSTASEWIFQTQNGNFASVVDLGFGVGLEILTDN